MDTDAAAEQVATIEALLTSGDWARRLEGVSSAGVVFHATPTERTVERLLNLLGNLVHDEKWEVRRSVAQLLADVRRPQAKAILRTLTTDNNNWVRQAASRGLQRQRRLHVADKIDPKTRFALDAAQALRGASSHDVYRAALQVGERFYEELAGDTAHELNTHRAGLELLLEELEHELEEAPAPAKQIIDRLKERSRRLSSLVEALLTYTREDAGSISPQLLLPIVDRAVELACEKTRQRYPGREVGVLVQVSGSLEVPVRTDRIVRAIANLVSNAMEASAHGETVTVVAAVHAGDECRLTIKDQGRGMTDQQLEDAKRRFCSLKKSAGGVGLGLPMAIKIVEREHEGRVELSSEPDVGTTVTIDLALAVSSRNDMP